MKTEGALYEATKGMSVKQLTAHIRKVVRDSAKLGVIPDDWRYSVRYEAFAWGADIQIKIVIPDELAALRWESERMLNTPMVGHNGVTIQDIEPVQRVAQTLELVQSIHEDYNFYESPIYEDGCSFRYGGQVTVISDSDYDTYYR